MSDELPSSVPNVPAENEPFRRPTPETILGRAWRLRCPRCGQGRLFRGWFSMHDRCEECGFAFQRGPGYYLGSMYVNYGMTAMVMTVCFVSGRFLLGLPGPPLIWGLFPFCLIFPIMNFRHARAFWLGLDCIFDKSLLEEPPVAPPRDPRSVSDSRH